ncbi:MAG: hypothetical protein ACODAB_06265, partial [Gemmatimonadota bacterium]
MVASLQAETGFTPVLPWLILLLPLVGAAVNGLAAFVAPERKGLPTVVGPAAIVGAFGVVLANFAGMVAAPPEAAVVVSLWEWMPSGDLSVGVDLGFDQLSMLMMLIVTGVSSVIHVYSVGYMREDPGYAKYFS